MMGWRIVCDVGGTNLRIARSDAPKLVSHVQISATETCASLPSMLRHYWQQFDDHENLLDVAVAAAGPVEQSSVTLTNSPLTVQRSAISTSCGDRPVILVNDLEAAAYAIPVLTNADLHPVVNPSNPASGHRIVVNVGTGFGAALLIQTATGWQPVATEAGHMTLIPVDGGNGTGDKALTAVTIEDRISGLALSRTSNAPFSHPDAAAAFGELFGEICGNLVLATGAWGGVYLCGSVASAWCRTGEFAAFTRAFRTKGRMSHRMHHVPAFEIVLPDPALIGLTTLGRSLERAAPPRLL